LAIALILAVLYFGLIELLLIDSSRELAAARRFRAQVVAQTLAENAAERVARDLINTPAANYDEEDDQGRMLGRMKKTSTGFVITGDGWATGVEKAGAKVVLNGTIKGSEIRIDTAQHPPQ
jgi:hypothetical protein